MSLPDKNEPNSFHSCPVLLVTACCCCQLLIGGTKAAETLRRRSWAWETSARLSCIDWIAVVAVVMLVGKTDVGTERWTAPHQPPAVADVVGVWWWCCLSRSWRGWAGRAAGSGGWGPRRHPANQFWSTWTSQLGSKRTQQMACLSVSKLDLEASLLRITYDMSVTEYRT